MLKDEVVSLVGFARRSGRILVGQQAVLKGLSRRRVKLVVFAHDFSTNARRRMLPHLAATAEVTFGSKQEWGAYWDRKEVGVFAILDANLAKEIERKIGGPAGESERSS